MQKLLSIPENLVASFHHITGKPADEWFVACDPGSKIGSGGGTAWMLALHMKATASDKAFQDYLAQEKKIIIHAGGHSRRLPSYAPSGKVLTPIPVFRWSQGQKLDQVLVDLQMPLLVRTLDISGPSQNTLIAAGDVLIQSPDVFHELPQADVVCLGIWVDPHVASNHGVFFTSRTNPQQLDFMLQKPDHGVIENLSSTHLYLMDIGIWILSDRAVAVLMKKCGWNGSVFTNGVPSFYDLYSTFGTCLGMKPAQTDAEISSLTTAIVPLHHGSFYHYGTSADLIHSTETIQNKIQDQRNIWHNRVKPHPSLFVQNSIADVHWAAHHDVWIENSHIPSSWMLQSDHVITGVPGNDWDLKLKSGICLDIVPVGEQEFCIRPYGMNDRFKGDIGNEGTLWMGTPVSLWFSARNIAFTEAGLAEGTDIQSAAIFPVVRDIRDAGRLIMWMLDVSAPESSCKSEWLNVRRISADEICTLANLERLFKQRRQFRQQNLRKLSLNFRHSVFYQSDLRLAAVEFAAARIALPESLPATEPALLRCRDHMFHSEVLRINGLDGSSEEANAFRVMQESLTDTTPKNAVPQINIFPDQIIWGRSPARLDLAGGWSDTPPYCLQNGGSVINMAVELNGQPPIQVFIRLQSENTIILRSIDNGVSEVISTFEDLGNFRTVGSAFSIPKAALCLAGFHPDFCGVSYKSLNEQLKDFGGGFEISLLAAIPKGSGLGTSSILAATILGTISDFCSLNWDHRVICHRTLVLEQLLTTGGGWQDQYGGILPGIKLLESEPGIQDKISIRWMPDQLFTRIDRKECWLLYYTGVTRIAKNILAEIVRGMFLNEGDRLRIVDDIKQHAYYMAEALQRSDYELTGRMIARSWLLNNMLDQGTNTHEIRFITDRIQHLAIGYKLLGAGGGGYMLIAAKDPDAAVKIQMLLNQDPPNMKARFVKMEVSTKGFQVSRS